MTKLKTRDLLPNYMKVDRWLDLADSIDSVFGLDHGLQKKLLGYIRHQFIPNNYVDQKAADGLMIDYLEWDMPDRTTAALQTELDGLKLTDASYVGQYGFVNLHRNIGTFWYSKGLGDFVDFISFTLNTRIQMVNLWTEDYVNFLPEEDFRRSGNVPVYSGGTWYPTSHVRLRFNSEELSLTYQELLVRLFYDISNFNLVLNAVEELNNMWIAESTASPPVSWCLTTLTTSISQSKRHLDQ